MRFETLFVTLFAVATAVALLARWMKAPYTVALVVAGVLLGTVRAFDPPHLTKELLFAVFLPGLLFEAAFHLEFRKFWQNKIAIGGLAVPGLLVSIGVTAAILTPVANGLHFVEGFTMLHALVFSALIAATDPIAVVALFKSLGAPKRLVVLVEGESLLNDGTAAVVFTLMAGLATGRELSPGLAVLDFVRVVGMGALIGTAIAFGASKVIQQVDDPMIEITVTTIAAYGSFAAAEQFHFSGVIATVSAGMVCGNYATRTGMSPSTRIAVESFWEYVAFALNSVVFLLIGFEVRMDTMLASWKAILTAYAAVTIGRAAVIYLVTAMLSRSREKLPWAWSAVLTWGGLRGGLSMVLVLALPPSFAHRDLLVTMTFGVVLISILLQGLTMGPLLRRLGLVGGGNERGLLRDRERGQVRAARAALESLTEMSKHGGIAAETATTLRTQYEETIATADRRIAELHVEEAELRDAELLATRRQLLTVEKETLLDAGRRGLLESEAIEHLLRDVDARLFRLDAGEDD
jgi:CPA1 family monovalent cation:H+ antiporter